MFQNFWNYSIVVFLTFSLLFNVYFQGTSGEPKLPGEKPKNRPNIPEGVYSKLPPKIDFDSEIKKFKDMYEGKNFIFSFENK